MQNPVLVVIDIQKEYTTEGRPFFLKTAGPSLKNAKFVLEHARKNAWPVIHVKHLQAGNIFNPESEFSEFVSEFMPAPQEKVVTKGNFSCYSAPEFVDLMKQYQDRKVIVVGYGSTMCCLSTIIDGYHRGQKFTYLNDASCAKRGVNFDEQDTHAHATEILATYCEVVPTATLIGL